MTLLPFNIIDHARYVIILRMENRQKKYMEYCTNTSPDKRVCFRTIPEGVEMNSLNPCYNCLKDPVRRQILHDADIFLGGHHLGKGKVEVNLGGRTDDRR